MTVSLATVHVLVSDPDAALVFYRDLLGLRVRSDVEVDGGRRIALTTVSQPGISIVLSQPHAGRSQEDGDVLAALLTDGELRGPSFRTDDLDATFDILAAAPGVEVLQEPISQPSGVRDIAVFDPSRNVVRIQQEEDSRCPTTRLLP